MRHPYIITYKESFMDKRCLCIVMDYADGGDLYTKIANQKKIGRGKCSGPIENRPPFRLRWANFNFVRLCCSVLQWGSDFRLVCADGPGNQAHPRPQDPPPWPQDSKHLHDAKWPNQNWRFRDCKGFAAYIRLRVNCYWNSLLPIPRNMSGEALQLEVRYLVLRLHLVRDGHIKACVWCKLNEGPGAQNLER